MASYIIFGLSGLTSIIGLCFMALLNEKFDDRLLLIGTSCLGVIG